MNVLGALWSTLYDHAESLEAAQQELSESERRELDEQTQAAEER
ncbi:MULTISPECIES: hypothetical protein [Actinomadura]|uniref:Uncharacterized protein n=1 Tax=Actinomadura yumaensis TaxID=111807 RepID=A0ABW2CPP3_9ACTN|nr:hypothetical protein [Actinomadura sp. J1-007]